MHNRSRIPALRSPRTQWMAPTRGAGIQAAIDQAIKAIALITRLPNLTITEI